MIHGHWLAERGLDASYEKIEVTPSGLPDLLDAMRNGTYWGGNLTVPLKEAVVPLLDDLTPDARAMAAVNTVFKRGHHLIGANTDVGGFFAHLDQAMPDWNKLPADVLVLGAGGASRAVVHGLLQHKVRSICLCNRSPQRAQALLAMVSSSEAEGSTRVTVADWPANRAMIENAALVINTTSLGMKGQPALELEWPDTMTGRIAYDIVYAPLRTAFLEQAEQRGAHVVDGLGMLLHQAALAFGYWFDDIPLVTPALRALVEADLMRPVQPGAEQT